MKRSINYNNYAAFAAKSAWNLIRSRSQTTRWNKKSQASKTWHERQKKKRVSLDFNTCHAIFLNKYHSVGSLNFSDFFKRFVKQKGKSQTTHKQAGRKDTLTPSKPTLLSPQLYRGHETEISPETQFMATKKRPEAQHRGKDLPRSICATSAQWKVYLNKSLWGEYTTALEKCIDKSTLMCVLCAVR